MAQWGDRLGIEFFDVEDVLWPIVAMDWEEQARDTAVRKSSLSAASWALPRGLI